MEPTRADFEAMQRGDKAASERIHGHVNALRQADPRRTYQEHLTATRARAFAGPKPPTPSREDFAAAERGGNPDAKARIATHVQWLLALDPLTRYSTHYENLKAEVSRVTVTSPTETPAARVVAFSPATTTATSATPSRISGGNSGNAGTLGHLQVIRRTLDTVLARARSEQRLCFITPEEGRTIASAAASCGDLFSGERHQLWQIPALGLRWNCDGSARFGQHYIEKAIALVNSEIASHSAGAA